MIHRVRGSSLWNRAVMTLMLVLAMVRAFAPGEATTREASVLRSAWRNGQIVYATHPLPSIPAQAPDVNVRLQRVYASAAYAQASRMDRIPVRPSTALPRSPWGDARWNPVNDKIEYRPFSDPSLWYYIGTVRQAVNSVPSYQAALNAAIDRDIVEMTADIVLTPNNNNIVYPNRGDTGWVLVRTTSHALLPALPPPGVDPNYAYPPSKPSPTGHAGHPRFLVRTQPAANNGWGTNARGWMHRGLVMQNDRVWTDQLNAAGPTQTMYSWAGQNQTGYTQQPSYLVMEQCLFDGLAGPGVTGVKTGYHQQQAVAFSGEYAYVRRCRFPGILADNTESKCVGGSRGLGKMLFVDCSMMGGSMHSIWGGSSCSPSAEYMSDIIMRQIYGHRPAAMLDAPWAAGVKNHHETKNSQRVVWEGNDNAGHDSQGQIGDWNIGCKAQNATEEAWVKTWDCCVRHNLSRNGAAPIEFANSPTPGSGEQVLDGVKRIEYYNNLTIDQYPLVAQGWQLLFGATSLPNNVLQRRSTDCKLHRNTTHIKRSVTVTCSAWLAKDAAGVPKSNGANTGAGFNMFDNVLYRDASSSALTAMFTGTGGFAANFNDVHLDQTCGIGLYTVRNNLHNVANKTDAQAWGTVLGAAPHNNKNKSAATMSFADPASGDYTLSEAAYQTMSTQGGRPGVNMILLNALLQDVTP